jgi:general stress protein YciG
MASARTRRSRRTSAALAVSMKLGAPPPTPPSTASAEAPASSEPGAVRPKQRRGFACMSPEKQRAIASKGGKASHAAGTGHEWTRETAREAGRKGGIISRGGRGKLPASGA